jgi:hypothetical protein
LLIFGCDVSKASAARDIEKPWSTTSHKMRNCSIFIQTIPFWNAPITIFPFLPQRLAVTTAHESRAQDAGLSGGFCCRK